MNKMKTTAVLMTILLLASISVIALRARAAEAGEQNWIWYDEYGSYPFTVDSSGSFWIYHLVIQGIEIDVAGQMSGTSMTSTVSGYGPINEGEITISGSYIGTLDAPFPSATSASGMATVTVTVSIPTPDGVFTTTQSITEQWTAERVGGEEAPTASFTYSPSFPATDEDVQFNDASTDPDGTIVSWFWSFGDGGTSMVRNPIHSYSSEGTYTVWLTVTDDDGLTHSCSEILKVSVYLANMLPTDYGLTFSFDKEKMHQFVEDKVFGGKGIPANKKLAAQTISKWIVKNMIYYSRVEKEGTTKLGTHYAGLGQGLSLSHDWLSAGEILARTVPAGSQYTGKHYGDCTDFTNLYVALCRSVGIETRKMLIPGVHAFTESKTNGDWVHCDPTWDVWDDPYIYWKNYVKDSRYSSISNAAFKTPDKTPDRVTVGEIAPDGKFIDHSNKYNLPIPVP